MTDIVPDLNKTGQEARAKQERTKACQVTSNAAQETSKTSQDLMEIVKRHHIRWLPELLKA